jgi:hypothetical protein
MSFLKALWSFVKSHPVGSVVVFVVILPLTLGGVAVSIYRLVKGGVAKVSPALASKLPEK